MAGIERWVCRSLSFFYNWFTHPRLCLSSSPLTGGLILLSWPDLRSYTMTSWPTVTGYITSCLTAHLSAGSLTLVIFAPSAERGDGHGRLSATLEHHICGQRTNLSTAGGESFSLLLPHTCFTNLGLLGVLSCSGVPDGADVQNLNLLKDRNINRSEHTFHINLQSIGLSF